MFDSMFRYIDTIVPFTDKEKAALESAFTFRQLPHHIIACYPGMTRIYEPHQEETAKWIGGLFLYNC